MKNSDEEPRRTADDRQRIAPREHRGLTRGSTWYSIGNSSLRRRVGQMGTARQIKGARRYIGRSEAIAGR